MKLNEYAKYITKYLFILLKMISCITWRDKMHHLKRRTIPFAFIVGQEDMKVALILNAVNPSIGGVLIRGDKGTAKSTAVRALAHLLETRRICATCALKRCKAEGPLQAIYFRDPG
jgi:Mg-chelatase subunit ChlI